MIRTFAEPPWPSLRDTDDWASSATNGSSGSDGGHREPGEKLQEWSSLIGIVTAIVGNVLIALALNVQRYAHIQLHKERHRIRRRAREALKQAHGAPQTGTYGTIVNGSGGNGYENGHANGEQDGGRLEARDSDPLMESYHSGDSNDSDSQDEDKAASTYLKSPYWWLGQVLITLGEMGNFLAYGFAPASIVSPLGVVALVSNCIIAPAMFHERFRVRDFWGVVIAVGGVVTVVLSAKQEETKLNPHDVWDAITSTAFEIYLGVTVLLIVILMWASTKYGRRTILIDLGLVGLFGLLSQLDKLSTKTNEMNRRLHGPGDQRRLFNALVNSLEGIHHSGHLRPPLHLAGHSGHADSLRQQGAAAVRFNSGHPHPVRHVYALRDCWQRCPISGL